MPGVSATASVAAWANLLPAPITNVSNVYLALNDLGVRAFKADSAPSVPAPVGGGAPGVAPPLAGPDNERIERVRGLERPGRTGVQGRFRTLRRRAVGCVRARTGDA